MDYIALIISIVALVGAGFAFIRANSSHHILGKRIESLKEKNTYLEARVRKLEGSAGKGNRPAVAVNEPVPRNQPRQEQPERQEQRQKQRERQPQQERQTQQQERQQQPKQEQPQQPKKKKENRRRNEPMETNKYDEIGQQQEPRVASAINLEVAGGDLLAELEQQAAGKVAPQHVQPVQQVQPENIESGKRYAIIPEDGVIRQHQLQQRPDSDSYIEVDVPADGSNMTGYRFNLSGNHAFVISQGIDRLENAFDFEKPSNRMVSRVVLQGDGVLTKVNNGWKIQEKARIDFR